jgi:hypothetical protein
MAFEPNLGQTDAQVRYLARGRGYAVFVTDEEAVLALAGRPAARSGADRRAIDEREQAAGEALRMRLANAREPQVAAERELPGKSNYLVGEDESTWLRDVPTYAAVRWAGVYEGVDAVFYGTQQQLEYDLVVAPGADASQIRVRFEGQQSAEVDDAGELVLRMRGGEVRQQLPVAFEQGSEGRRVAARYVVTGDGEVGVDVGEYDRTRPLVIDPVIVYSDFLGGDGDFDQCTAIAIDASGAAYVTGDTQSQTFPITGFAFDATHHKLTDTFVTKFSADGSTLVYSTFLGGAFADYGEAIAVDSSGAAYVTGTTTSTDFPTTAGAFDRTSNGSTDIFVTKLAAAGSSLAYSTYLGGSGPDSAAAVAIDASGAAYVTGSTGSGFPTTPGAFDTTFNGGVEDAYVLKLAAAGSSLVYSTFLGSSQFEQGGAIAVDASGAAYVTG